VALHQEGRLAEAERSYQAVLQQQPNHFDALHLLGVVALQTGQSARSVELIDKAIVLRPDFAEAHNNRGLALLELRRFDEAIASFDGAVALKPSYAEAYNNRGFTLQQLQQLEAALTNYDKAIALRPDYAQAYSNRGNALQELQRPLEALANHDKAIALTPGNAQAHYNRGIALQDLQRHDEAVASYDNAIALDPGYVDAHFNRGVATQALERPEQAVASYDKVIALRPDFAGAYANRGPALQDIDRHDEALASYRRAVALNPDHAQMHVNTGLCLLKLGDMPPGWAEYEWRWKAPHITVRDFPVPLWLGEQSLAGKIILLHAEQGFGDTMQFCRYARLVAARGAQVVLEVQRPLARLMASLGVGTIVARGDPLPLFDLHCPLMSLPLAFGTTIETIPQPGPYLAADPIQAAAWRQRLASLPGRCIGLVWAGSGIGHAPEVLARNRRRSITLGHLAPLARVPGLSFVSLQKGESASQTSALSASMQVHDYTDELTDFADTAALVAALDLIISVDTAVVHLAGALGKPVWVLNRFDSCWRWLLNRTDTPWYPTARLFRQRAPGDWNSVIAEVGAALRVWATGAD
jgi:tetratricopeptide (TPR) repeat protein